jgi:hypothetical protein
MSEHVSNDEPYLLVEEVAERLGLPLAVLLRRVEAGDIPSRRVERPDGYHYALRLSDLGIEVGDVETAEEPAAVEQPGPEPDDQPDDQSDDEPDGISVFDESDSRAVESAIASAFNGEPAPAAEAGDSAAPASEAASPAAPGDRPGWAERAPGGGSQWHGLEEARAARRDSAQPLRPASSSWTTRPLEPQQPPAWIRPELSEAGADDAEPGEAAAADAAEAADAADAADAEAPGPAPDPPIVGEHTAPFEAVAAAPAGDPDAGKPATVAEAEPDAAQPVATPGTAAVPTAVPTFDGPERRRDPSRGLLDVAIGGSRGDLASISLDARDLVAGLLDRWERTLEQRIYTEQRQRFQSELTTRQNMVKQLQLELQAVRAEHAAAQAEKDRLLAEKERELADRERDLAEVRRYAVDTDRLIAPAASARRRRWFRTRDDDG